MTQLSNVPTQPTDATEPLTLIEKLEQLSDEYLNQYTAYGDNADLNCSSAVDDAIDIVKRHQITLIEKLEQEVKRLGELKAQEKPHSLAYVFLGHHIAATVNAINIVKRHEAESEVQA